MVGKKAWQLVIADELDYETAKRIGGFIRSFATPTSDRSRRTRSPEYYMWKIRRNPAGRGFVSLAIDKDRLVGTTTVTRKKIYFRGQLIDGAEIGDTFTDPAYQRQSIFTSLVIASRDRATEAGVRLIYGTPNIKSLQGYEKNCSFLRKRGVDLFLWVFPFKPARLAWRKADLSKFQFIPRAIDQTVAWTSRMINAFMSNEARETELLFDETFDELNETLSQRYAFMCSRSAADLKFRLAENPEKDRYGLIVKRNPKSKLDAALVYKDTAQSGMKVLFIADLFGVWFRAMSQVWNTALLVGIERKYDLVAIWAPRRWSSLFSMLPVPPVPIARKEVIFYDSDLGREAISDSGEWLFSIIDSDNI